MALAQMHQGKEWDYVFDVDIAEGAPPRKLPYNRSENPYIAADRFIEEEGLPLYFKEQVSAIQTLSVGRTYLEQACSDRSAGRSCQGAAVDLIMGSACIPYSTSPPLLLPWSVRHGMT